MRYFKGGDLVEMVKARINYDTTQRDIAKEFGISPAYLSDFLQGKRWPGPAILKGLGFEVEPYFKRAHR